MFKSKNNGMKHFILLWAMQDDMNTNAYQYKIYYVMKQELCDACNYISEYWFDFHCMSSKMNVINVLQIILYHKWHLEFKTVLFKLLLFWCFKFMHQFPWPRNGTSFMSTGQDINPWNEFKITATSPRGQCIDGAYIFHRASVSQQIHWNILPLCYINGLMQKRCNSLANTLELHLFCSKPSVCTAWQIIVIHSYNHMYHSIYSMH